MITTQPRTAPAAGNLSAKTPAKSRKERSTDSGDQVAAQFAAMFASLCPAPTPTAKAQAGAPNNTAGLEIAEAESTTTQPIKLETPAPSAGTELAATAKDFSSIGKALASPEQTPDELILPQADVLTAAATIELKPPPGAPADLSGPSSAPPEVGLKVTLPVTAPDGNARLVNPIQVAAETATGESRARSAVDEPVEQVSLAVADNSFTKQNLQTEATRRDANLVASYLATTARDERVAGIKPLQGGRGFDLRQGDGERDADFAPRIDLAPGLAGMASFAATARAVAGAAAGSVPLQTASEIMAMANTLSTHETRSLRLRLKPEELGQIDIQLSRDAAGRISAHISAERESARIALSQSLDQLRETLSRAGISVDKLQIRASPDLSAGSRESADARSNSGQSPSAIANLLNEKETGAGHQPRTDDQRLLNLRA